MHVLFRESHGLDETAIPQDLGQAPADLVVLSFSDSDLGAFAAGWTRGRTGLPTLRLGRLSDLRHPLSVDTYLDTLSHARGILVRLIGGKPYWPYGVEQLSVLARDRGIALAFLSGDGMADPVLDAASTLPVPVLRKLADLCSEGGEVAAHAALVQLALSSGLDATPVTGAPSMPNHGFWHPQTGPVSDYVPPDGPLICIPFYRSWLVAADTAAVAALIHAFETAGHNAVGMFVPSIKEPTARAWLYDALAHLYPVAVVNATAFSGRDGGASPLDAAGVPVFQVIHATNDHAAWQASDKGLSAADLAMHVALPELDGRLHAGIISFKEKLSLDPDLQIGLQRHRPAAELIPNVVSRILNRISLSQTTGPRVFVLSTYPSKEWRMAHAVGLDVLASVAAMMTDRGAPITGEGILSALGETRLQWPVEAYRTARAALPDGMIETIDAAHGTLDDDPLVNGNTFGFRAFWHGGDIVALQPERGAIDDRVDGYHDLSRVPSHGYVAFHLWLHTIHARAVVHVGAHGTLEWLPGKAAGLGPTCWPETLIAGLPVIYPFIVSDPGEAAQARRRLGALTLGHLPPPMQAGETPDQLARLEQLLDEYSTAEGLDPSRRKGLIPLILAEARTSGLEASLGLSEDTDMAALTAIDAFVCDMKESQFAAGLHIWGRGTPDETGAMSGDTASITAERAAMATALHGSAIAPGPSGSPWRGRSDVLPTGRALYGIDPRAVPSRSAWAQGVRLADDLVRRHLQDHGDYPKSVMVNLWGSATMRTSGEDYAMALHLAGIKPVWDNASGRVTGFDVTPLAELDRPRIGVTLRISGLFRDTFGNLAELFEHGCAVLSARDEAVDMNPYVADGETTRVFAPAAGQYGTGQMPDAASPTPSSDLSDAVAKAWFEASAYTATGAPAHDALHARMARIDTFVLTQDLPESDLLMAMDYASHIGGFAAAATGQPALYHMDTTRADAPKVRPLCEELARITHARATQSGWLRAMQNHGFRGAAEIAATLEHLAAFARLTQAVSPHLFDAYHRATLGNSQICAFMEEYNPAALAAMRALFEALAREGLCHPFSNSGALR